MAQKKRKTINSNKNGKKKTNNTKNRQSNTFVLNKQLTAVILFAVSILWFCLSVIDAGGAWGAFRTLLFGLFGFASFIYPLLLLVITVFFALDKTDKGVISKFVQAGILITIISSIVHIAQCAPGSTYFEAIKDAFNYYYIDGSMLGGGVWGALFGGLTLLITGGSKLAAMIIQIVLLFVFVMVITGLTLATLFNGISKPVKKIGEFTGEKISEYNEKVEQNKIEREKRKKEFNPDVDLGPSPEEINKTDEQEESIEQDDIIPFDTINGEELFADKLAEESSNNDKEENIINLDDLINNDLEEPEQIKLDVDDSDENDEYADEEWNNEPVKEYIMPPIDLLNLPHNVNLSDYEREQKLNERKLIDTLNSFGVSTRLVGVSRGPSVTRYEIQPAAGVKISKITNLADDIALNLAASGVRIEAPIPNKAAVGIEVPNKSRQSVTLREVIDHPTYKNAKSKLTVALGKDITGEFVYSDLVKMPHLLIAGTTGSGKSVCLNSMIVSILYNATPDEVKLLMIDPKQVEFTIYNGIPHLLVPVVSDPKKASGALAWAVTEMLTRYKMFSENSVRDISGYNSVCESQGKKKLPQIVIFIDELSDLMMAAPNEVEDSICRLAQMARAAGMHLVIATQRPSVDVITGIIKANIPSRISLSVSSQVDSRTIIDSVGAEKLLGNGDMLYYPVGIPKPVRVQGCYLSDKEVENVVTYIKNQEQTSYDDGVMKEIDRNAAQTGSKKKDTSSTDDGEKGPADEMLPKAIEVVIEAQSASTTLLQRKLKLGYARAARIIDDLETNGVIGPYEGAKPRKVLISKQQWYEMNALAQGGADKPYGEDDENNEE